MARYPGAIWRPLDATFLPGRRLAAHNRMNLHVAVSEAASLHGFFNAKGRASSHFYVRKDGTVEQYVDTDQQAEADLDGNDGTVSVETQGGLTNAQGEPWTPSQVRALAALFSWAADTHGIPRRLAQDSRPGTTSRGLSWHRLGIDPWRVEGGMRYSASRGKVCPGDAKIAQIPYILNLANEVGSTEPEDPDMAFTEEQARQLAQIAADTSNVYHALFSGGPATPGGRPVLDVLKDMQAAQQADTAEVAHAIAAAIPDDLAAQVLERLSARLDRASEA